MLWVPKMVTDRYYNTFHYFKNGVNRLETNFTVYFNFLRFPP